MFKIILSILVSTMSSWASQGEIVYPLGIKGANAYLNAAKSVEPKLLGFDPKAATVTNENTEGAAKISSGSQSIMVYDVDANNDGQNEYVAIYVGGGSLGTSGIMSVIEKNGKVIEFDKVVSSSLWGDDSGDLAKLHLWLAAPAIVKRDGKIIIRYLDTKPKTLFTEYLWEGKSFTKIRESSTNSY